MKKIYLIILAIGIFSCAFSQKRAIDFTKTPSINNDAVQKVNTATDTILGWLLTGGIATIYSSTNGGYLCGVNGWGDKAKLQQFNTTTAYNVEGCIYWLGGKRAGGSTGNPNSVITCNIYNMDGLGYNSTGALVPAPRTVATGTTYLWDNIDSAAFGPNGFVTVTFPVPYSAAPSSSYAAGIDFSTLAPTDTTGFVSNAIGQAGATELSWELWSDDTMHTIYSAWTQPPADIDLGVFPIVDNSVGIAEYNSINGIKLFQNQPNPFNSESIITYALDKNAKDVKIMIFDLNGKLIKTFEQGAQKSGEYNIQLKASDFSDGIYYFAIQADHNRLAKKMTVLK